MNTYLYAPKDDLKHRAEWRILYTVEEADLLESLIRAARESNVTFVYALSPGIDIVYSNPKEVKAIQDKLKQVQSLGCTAFALLFDDIEPSMNEHDRKQFPSFVVAQLVVSNTVYEHMGCPLFMFCPTEYCESRAVPTLEANDYDPKRVFLGPFAGRPVGLKSEISGLLLNPNSKYEANFIPFFTLADWNRSDRDAPKSEYDDGWKLEIPLSDTAVQATQKRKSKQYHPLNSLKRAISQMETQTVANVIESTAISSSVPPPSIRTCEGNDLLPTTDLPPPLYTSSPIGNATTVTVQAFPLSESITGVAEAHDMMIPQTVNSLTSDYNEPMEVLCNLPKETVTSTAMEMTPDGSDIPMEDEQEISDAIGKIDSEKVALLVDMFYLPFEHGQRGVNLLEEFQWLHENAQIIRSESEANEKEANEWLRRFDAFTGSTLVQEMFPYVWEAQGIVSVLCALLQWMREGNLLVAPTGTGSWWSSGEVDLEPWALGGGLLPDLQKLVVTSPQLADLFTIKFSIPLSLTCYTIKPLDVQQIDKELFYDIFSTCQEKELVESIMTSDRDEFFFDKSFSPFIKYGVPPHHFMAEELNINDGVQTSSIGFGILNIAGSIEDFQNDFISLYKSKYSKTIDEDDMSANKEERLQLLNSDAENFALLHLPMQLIDKYPSMVEIRWRNYSTEAVAVRRLLHVLAASLAMNGILLLFYFT
ncbi:beta-N-acetylglucosaminidase domain-containing protein [Ditylenchus destructor]|uniref:Beta-N-acetylglucosaminidase domain-containing protein n=1 Tax=Ditylenchus destructor TaxID=166010 RepID=A0AAD4NDI0_9BILA|nr:beta-N-acetylglucosaminidase domain-containing protein [Ditylenchus destructor]